MKRTLYLTMVFCALFLGQQSYSQVTETPTKKEETKEESAEIKAKKEKVIAEEKEALKKEVLAINERYNNGEITEEEAKKLKAEAAEISALNIENKIAIIENSQALEERTDSGAVIRITADDTDINISNDPLGIEIKVMNEDEDALIEIYSGKQKRYDKRTHSNLLVAFGFNNAIIEGQSINDSPYKIGKSKFFEIGWVWSTRVLDNSNAVRFRYGFSFTFNGLNPDDNQYFVQDGDLTYLDNFDYNLSKAKLRMDNLVVPLHFEFGPSRKIESKNYFRYSTRRKFKFGIGGYAGLNIGTRQKLKYTQDGSKEKDKLKRSYNTANFIYGLSSYIGVDSFSFYVKYDLNEIFNDPNPKQNNISLGLRFDI